MSELKENYEKADAITWVQVHNLLPVVAMLIGMGITWGIFTSRLDNIDKSEAKIQQQLDIFNTSQYNQDILLERIRTRLGMAEVIGVSTNSAERR